MHNSARGRGMQNLQVSDGFFVKILFLKTALVGVDFSSENTLAQGQGTNGFLAPRCYDGLANPTI